MEVWFLSTVPAKTTQRRWALNGHLSKCHYYPHGQYSGLGANSVHFLVSKWAFLPNIPHKRGYALEENLEILWFILSRKNETQKGVGQQTQVYTVSSEAKIDCNSSLLTLRPRFFLCFTPRCPRLTQTHVKLCPGTWEISLLYCISVCTVAHGY